MKKVYVVSIPWDSASVDKTFVFSNVARAKQFLDAQNEKGYHGYCNGLQLEECYIDTSKPEPRGKE